MDIHEHARNTLVADLPNGTTIVLAHPGQPLNRDPKYLLDHFGVLPHHVTSLAESRARPLTAEEKAAERSGGRAARRAELEAELAALDAAEAPARKTTPPKA